MHRTHRKTALFFLVFLVLLALPLTTRAEEQDLPTVYAITIDGEITPAMAAFMEGQLERAAAEAAAGVILEIRTLGGRVDAAIDMRDAILASTVPVVVYIENRAISAGALIAIASDTIIMAPGSHIGAAEPVPNEPKALAYVSGEFKTTAEKSGRDPQIALAMVDASVEIEGLVATGAILDMTASEAQQYGYADHLVRGRQEVLAYMGWSNARVIEAAPDFRQRVAQFLTSYEVASILLSLGMLGILIELYTPGFGAPGIVGILCIVLYFAGGLLAGSTDWWAAVIFFTGLVLVGIEIAVPGFGIFGVSGLIALLVGVVLAAPTPRQGIGVLAIALAVTLIAIPVLIKVFGHSRLVKRLVLSSAETVEAGYTHGPRERTDLHGKVGMTQTVLRPAGSVIIDGIRVDAIADGVFIEKDTPVRVVRVDGTKVIVMEEKGNQESRRLE